MSCETCAGNGWVPILENRFNITYESVALCPEKDCFYARRLGLSPEFQYSMDPTKSLADRAKVRKQFFAYWKRRLDFYEERDKITGESYSDIINAFWDPENNMPLPGLGEALILQWERRCGGGPLSETLKEKVE